MYSDNSGRGLVILANPCNQFANEESWPEAQIQGFLTSEYSVTFPVLGKGDVKGANICPLYQNLKQQAPDSEIEWNFAKYLLDSEGKFVKFFHHDVDPTAMMADIETLLNQQ